MWVFLKYYFNDYIITFVKIYFMKFSIYFLFFIAINTCFSQSTSVLSNEQYQKLHDKARALINSNVDSSFVYANKIEKSNDYLHQSFAKGIKSYLYQLKGDSVASKKYYKQAFVYLNSVKSSNEKIKLNAYLLNFGGLSEWKRGNLSNALACYKNGKELSEQAKDIIQTIKFNANMASIYGDSGNYRLAIAASKESDKLLDKYQYLLSKDQIENYKSIINLNLGNFYENYFETNDVNKALMDSIEYYYKKAIVYSKNFINTKISAQTNLANVYVKNKKFKEAEAAFKELLIITKESQSDFEYYNVICNLGRLFYTQNKYDKSLLCFKKVDSIYTISKTYPKEFYLSNYYQAKIYNSLNDPKKALYHSEIYLNSFEENESKLNAETKAVNLSLADAKFKNEMILINKKAKQNEWYNKIIKIVAFIAFVVVLVLFVKNNKEKKEANRKVKLLIEEFKNNSRKEQINSPIAEMEYDEKDLMELNAKSLNINQEKEEEILEKLKVLELKLQYLNPDFNQQTVAKKIKTNTTYLSYVVNKRFGKSFSEYSNELKINYAINEMISNPVYRKYSTQAIAESVGFKNASSFTKSFKKRTGVTPVLFAKNI